MTAHTHSSASSNFIYHYSFHHKISWTTWRRKPERLQWESLPTVRELLKYKPTGRQRPVRSVLSEGLQHCFLSQGWQSLCYGAVLLLKISQSQTSALLPLLFLPRNVSQASLSAGKEGHSCVHLLIITVRTALKFCHIMRLLLLPKWFPYLPSSNMCQLAEPLSNHPVRFYNPHQHPGPPVLVVLCCTLSTLSSSHSVSTFLNPHTCKKTNGNQKGSPKIKPCVPSGQTQGNPAQLVVKCLR